MADVKNVNISECPEPQSVVAVHIKRKENDKDWQYNKYVLCSVIWLCNHDKVINIWILFKMSMWPAYIFLRLMLI
jgi:hypothetical protein